MKFPLPPPKQRLTRPVFARNPPALLSLNMTYRGRFGDAVREAVAGSAAAANYPARRRVWQQILRFARLAARHFFRSLPHNVHQSSQPERLCHFPFKQLTTSKIAQTQKHNTAL
jgi:hypothetical protein